MDGNLLTGRGPDDLPQFCQQLMAFLGVKSLPILRPTSALEDTSSPWSTP